MKFLIGGGIVSAFAPMLLLFGLMMFGGSIAKPPTTAQNIYVAAFSDVPDVVAGAYVSAAAFSTAFVEQCQLRPSILAGIGWIETRHGTYGGSTPDPVTGDVTPPIIGIPLDGTNNTAAIGDSDGGRLDGDTTWDRAVGPMQFIPQTWARYGVDGNDDGVVDPQNVFDAAFAAANKICNDSPTAGSSQEGLEKAILAYNRSGEYLERVMERIRFYDRAFAMIGTYGTFGPRELLQHPNFTACDRAYEDIASGLVDPRAIGALSLIVQSHAITTCTIKTGHYQCVGGGSRAARPNCTESHHWYGRGVDIGSVNGQRVSVANAAAEEVVALVLSFNQSDPLRPSGIGSPFAAYSALPGAFTDADHTNHIHLGWCGPRYARGQLVNSCPAGQQ